MAQGNNGIRTPPYDEPAERALLGAAMVRDEALTVATALEVSDFWHPHHQIIAAAIGRLADRGQAVDTTTVAGELGAELEKVGGYAALGSLVASVSSTANAPAYAERVLKARARRRIIDLATDVAETVYAGGDPSGPAQQLQTFIDDRSLLGGRDLSPSPTARQLLDEPEPEHDWVIPGCLERGDRAIVTAGEGGGKSTLLRQMGVTAASGIHPFTLQTMDPQRVLIVDFENPRNHVRRKLRGLLVQAGTRLDDDLLRVEPVPEGINMMDLRDATWLYDRIDANRPDLVIIGPLYKMHDGDPIEEGPAKKVARHLDEIRVTFGCALVIEAHTPYANGASKRPMRPYGASMWARWPEFGIYLDPTGTITHWRGAREDDHTWPAMLERGGEWPWTPVTRSADITFARVLQEVHDARRRLSVRDLEGRTGVPRSTIDRVIKANQRQFDEVVGGYTSREDF